MTTSWFAIRVAPNAEFRALHALGQRERPAILPFEEKWIRKPNGKTDTKKFPLFTSYVFGGFMGDGIAAWSDFCRIRQNINEASERAGKAAPIVGVVGFGKMPSRLSSDEIGALEAISKPAGQHPDEITFTVGQNIKIVQHPFLSGSEARIQAIRKADEGRKVIRAILGGLGSTVIVDLQLSNVEAA